MAVWESAVKFRHHDLPDAKEYVGNGPEPQKVYDAIRLFNVYGYCTGKCGPARVSATGAGGRSGGAASLDFSLGRGRRCATTTPGICMTWG